MPSRKEYRDVRRIAIVVRASKRRGSAEGGREEAEEEEGRPLAVTDPLGLCFAGMNTVTEREYPQVE